MHCHRYENFELGSIFTTQCICIHNSAVDGDGLHHLDVWGYSILQNPEVSYILYYTVVHVIGDVQLGNMGNADWHIS